MITHFQHISMYMKRSGSVLAHQAMSSNLPPCFKSTFLDFYCRKNLRIFNKCLYMVIWPFHTKRKYLWTEEGRPSPFQRRFASKTRYHYFYPQGRLHLRVIGFDSRIRLFSYFPHFPSFLIISFTSFYTFGGFNELLTNKHHIECFSCAKKVHN